MPNVEGYNGGVLSKATRGLAPGGKSLGNPLHYGLVGSLGPDTCCVFKVFKRELASAIQAQARARRLGMLWVLPSHSAAALGVTRLGTK